VKNLGGVTGDARHVVLEALELRAVVGEEDLVLAFGFRVSGFGFGFRV